jgi:hypothetical protein
MLEWTDLVLDLDAMAKSAITGEAPEGPGELDILLDQAKQYCATIH